MRHSLVIVVVGLVLIGLLTMAAVQAQKFAYVDTEYILENIPAFKQAQTRLDNSAAEWQKEIDDKFDQVAKIFRYVIITSFMIFSNLYLISSY